MYNLQQSTNDPEKSSRERPVIMEYGNGNDWNQQNKNAPSGKGGVTITVPWMGLLFMIALILSLMGAA